MSAPAPSSSKHALSVTKTFRAYFPPAEVLALVQAQANGLPPSRIEQLRQQACGFIDRVGSRLGFPRRTIATAQVLYHRFHLFFNLQSFRFQDVSVAALLAAAKLEDTLKKLHEIQTAAHHVKQHLEGLPSAPPNSQVLDDERNGLLGIERLILETISFNFNLHAGSTAFGVVGLPELGHAGGAGRDVFTYVVKLAKHLALGKEATKLAFRLAIDTHRSLVPLSYPSHTIAASCIYLAFFLAPDLFKDTSLDPQWPQQVACDVKDLEDICHSILDLLLSLSTGGRQSGLAHIASLSASPAVSLTASPADPLPDLMSPAIDLTAVKIRLREVAQARPPSTKKRRAVNGNSLAVYQQAREGESDLLGRNDVSVRFLWSKEAA